MSDALRAKIEEAFADRTKLESAPYARAVEETLALLDRGELRVAERVGDAWTTHAWVKQAILLYFALRKMETSPSARSSSTTRSR
jgi:2,3,4,5-tetrahydropyridine-2-carboxylate N-succinyltransferase